MNYIEFIVDIEAVDTYRPKVPARPTNQLTENETSRIGASGEIADNSIPVLPL